MSERAGTRRDPDDRRVRIVGHVLLASGERVAVTAHCVDRFWERAAVGCTLFRYALGRLQELASTIGEQAPRPDWAGPPEPGERWIALGPDVGLVIVLLTRARASSAA